MNTKVILAAIVGAVFSFLLGWLLYGVIFADMMEDGMTESMASVMRPDDGYIYWGFAASGLAFSLLLAIIFNRFGISTFGKGAMAGAWIGFLFALSVDFGWYAQTTMMELNMIFMDALMQLITTALLGGVIGIMLGMGNKKKMATA